MKGPIHMKDLPGAIIVFFLCLFAFTKWVGPIPLSISSVVTNQTDTFSVSGEGNVTLVPDIATTTVGVTAQGKTVSAVQQTLNERMNAITTAVKKLGIDNKDIKTSGYNISPDYDYNDGRSRIVGYNASARLTVKVRKIDTINQVIDAATANGATDVSGVSFDVDDRTKAENEARAEAVTQAKTKAAAAAKAGGFSLGRIVNYSESSGQSPRPVMFDMAAESAPAQKAETTIEPGSTEVRLTVTLSYEIR